MALSVILILYASIGFLSVAGSIFLARKLFSEKGEQTFFALFLLPIAGFYLAFTAYFGNEGAWGLETAGVIAFAVLGLLGVRVGGALIIGYLMHGLWDILHEMQLHGVDIFGSLQATEVPLAYGAFCAAYDWCVAAYFYMWWDRSREKSPTVI